MTGVFHPMGYMLSVCGSWFCIYLSGCLGKLADLVVVGPANPYAGLPVYTTIHR
jgi:hypothetical protein